MQDGPRDNGYRGDSKEDGGRGGMRGGRVARGGGMGRPGVVGRPQDAQNVAPNAVPMQSQAMEMQPKPAPVPVRFLKHVDHRLFSTAHTAHSPLSRLSCLPIIIVRWSLDRS